MRILLVQDRKVDDFTLVSTLRNEGFAVDATLLDSKEFVRARFSGVDVVIFDVQHYAPCETSILRLWHEKGLDAYVVILCGNGSLADKVRALDQGADDFLIKPVQTPELLARLRSLDRRRHPDRIPILCIHDLEIDRMRRKVRRSGQQINLTPNEFSLLELLAQKPGQVMTPSMIARHLYEERAAVTSNVVAVYINYLRAKIDKRFKQPLILTKRGEGYLLRA
jgi:DNA-binding response OmpR family regulator